MSALDTMKSALQCSKTEAAKLRIRVRQLEEKLIEVAAIGEQEADKLRQGSEFLVAENARLVAANTQLKSQLKESHRRHTEAEALLADANGLNTPLVAWRKLVSPALEELHVVWHQRPRGFEAAQAKADTLTGIVDRLRTLALAASTESQPDPAPTVSIRQLGGADVDAPRGAK